MTDSTQIPETRGPGRPRADRGLREPVRETVASARTLKPGEFMGRDGEILSFKGDEYGDSFALPPHEIPEGWSYQWVRQSVLGNDDKTYSNNLPMKANGWREVPQDRHPHTLTNQRGMQLMERPAQMTAAAEHRERDKAMQQKLTRDEQHGLRTTTDSFNTPARMNRVQTSVMPMPYDIGKPALQVID